MPVSQKDGFPYGITLQEAEILADIAESFTQSQIAERRGVSKNTIRKQVVIIEEKLGCHSMGELARWWRDHRADWLGQIAALIGLKVLDVA